MYFYKLECWQHFPKSVIQHKVIVRKMTKHTHTHTHTYIYIFVYIYIYIYLLQTPQNMSFSKWNIFDSDVDRSGHEKLLKDLSHLTLQFFFVWAKVASAHKYMQDLIMLWSVHEHQCVCVCVCVFWSWFLH